ncbi:MAG: glycosyltransferase family 2 protein [Coriobacteriales bacterium]|jgi:glycosyltransferase involved in cell wall biosynthesis|nr:glycosyltransferase family 2 protein [Coriobacteriales bacterium]
MSAKDDMTSETGGPTSSAGPARALLVIPAHNEAESIVATVEGLRDTCPDLDFVVVNDGSTDTTALICRQRGFPLIDLATNLGLSAAVGAGMRYAYERGYGAVVQFDADGQHRPEYLEGMLDALDAGFDIVCGSRFLLDPKPRSLRMAGSRLISWAVRATTGQRLTDPTSGLRVYGRRVVKAFATQGDMTPEPDTVSHLVRLGARVQEVPVVMNERAAGTSYLGPLSSVRYMLRMAVSILLVQFFRKGSLGLLGPPSEPKAAAAPPRPTAGAADKGRTEPTATPGLASHREDGQWHRR